MYFQRLTLHFMTDIQYFVKNNNVLCVIYITIQYTNVYKTYCYFIRVLLLGMLFCIVYFSLVTCEEVGG